MNSASESHYKHLSEDATSPLVGGIVYNGTPSLTLDGSGSLEDPLLYERILAAAVGGEGDGGNQTERLADRLADVEPFSVPDLTYIYVLVTVFYTIFFLIGVVGNILVPAVVIANKDMRTPTNWSLVNLSIADLLVILVCVPAALVEFHAKDVWLLGAAMCKLVPFLENLAAFASSLIILVISFERYYAICHPFQVLYRCSTARAIKILICAWIVAMLSAVPFLFISYVELATFHDGSEVTVCRTPINTVFKHSYVLSTIVIFFLLPFVTVNGLYFAIARKLWSEAKELSMGRLPLREQEDSVARGRRQVIQLLIVIIIIFFICLMPIRVVALWYLYSSMEQKTQLGLEGYLNISCFARTMMYANSAVNPIIYNIVSAKFRLGFLRVLGKRPSQASLRRYSCTTMSARSSVPGRLDSSLPLRRLHCQNRFSESDVGRALPQSRRLRSKRFSVPDCVGSTKARVQQQQRQQQQQQPASSTSTDCISPILCHASSISSRTSIETYMFIDTQL